MINPASLNKYPLSNIIRVVGIGVRKHKKIKRKYNI
tara:strand:+ start:344 stop:451 length:108 start_codon:yes stop_codon:yes gene_type:complete